MDGRVAKTYRRTTMLMVFCTAVLAGLGLARLVLDFPGWLVVCLAVLLVVFWRQRSRMFLPCMILLGIALGCWRGGIYMEKLSVYDGLYKQTVTVRGVAQTDGTYDDSQISFTMNSLEFGHPVNAKVPGKMAVKGRGSASIFQGDSLQITGRLYKTRGSNQAGMSYAAIEVLGHNSTKLDMLRLRFSAGVRNALSEPHASFGVGLLIGQKASLPDDVSEDLSRVGLTHIIAVSGYNLTIIIELVRRRLKGRSKYQVAIWSLLLMGSFLLVTGFGASIVRAAVVSVLGLGAWYYGRTVRPVLLVLLVAALTAWWYPLYLWSDIGWYLSFLAFFGVLVIAPVMMGILERHSFRSSVVTLLMVESFCAQLMTWPIVMQIFNRLSVIGLLSNLLVVPLVPLGMLLTLFAGIAGMIVPPLSGWVGLPGQWVLVYMLDLAHLLAGWRYASVERQISVMAMLLMYAAILVLVVIAWRVASKNGMITDRNRQEIEGSTDGRSQQMVND